MKIDRHRIGLSVLTLLVSLLATGCVQRTINITSEPSGALVHLNDEEVGRTPVAVPFKFYGVYDVRLEKDGYKALWTKTKAKAPWWEFPGPDLIAEAIPNNSTSQDWHYDLEQILVTDEQGLVDRAGELRSTVQ